MTTLKASRTRIPPDTFNEVAYKGERVRIERRGTKPVYLISADDLALLEKLEDRYWAEEGERALKAFEQAGEPPVSWEEVKAELS
jgi:hypothetical protein